MWQLHMKMKQVYISYNGCCCVPGQVNNWSILWSWKNRTNCETDHTTGVSGNEGAWIYIGHPLVPSIRLGWSCYQVSYVVTLLGFHCFCSVADAESPKVQHACLQGSLSSKRPSLFWSKFCFHLSATPRLLSSWPQVFLYKVLMWHTNSLHCLLWSVCWSSDTARSRPSF